MNPCIVPSVNVDMDRIIDTMPSSHPLLREMSRVPVVGQILRAIHPAVSDLPATTPKGRLQRAVRTYYILKDVFENTAQIAASRLETRYPGGMKSLFPQLDRRGMGLFATRDGQKLFVHISDVLEAPMDLFELNSRQRAFKKDLWNAIDAVLLNLVKAAPNRQLRRKFLRMFVSNNLRGGGAHYIPRFAIGKEVEDPLTDLMLRFGKHDFLTDRLLVKERQTGRGTGRPKNLKPRFYDTATEGVVLGRVRYEDPIQSFYRMSLELGNYAASMYTAGYLRKYGVRVRGLAQAGVPREVEGKLVRFKKLNVSEMGITGDFLRDLWFPADIAEWIDKNLHTGTPKSVPVIGTFVSTAKAAMAGTADIGFVGMNALNLFAYDLARMSTGKFKAYPRSIGLAAVAKSLMTLLDPETLTRYYAENADVIQRNSHVLGRLLSSDMYDLLVVGRNNLLRYVPLLSPVLRRVGMSLEAGLDVARVEIMKAAEAVNPHMTDAEREAWGTFARNLASSFSLRRAGISPWQQGIENELIWFSARFTRGALALLGMALRPDMSIEATQARLALGHYAAAGLLIMAGVTNLISAIHEDPTATTLEDLGIDVPGIRKIKLGHFDVTKPGQFLKAYIPFPGDVIEGEGGKRPMGLWVGIGGPMLMLANLAGTLAFYAKEKPESMINTSVLAENNSNPLVDIWLRRASPAVSWIKTLVTGRNFYNEPVEFTDPEDLKYLIVSSTAPFSLTQLLEGTDIIGSDTQWAKEEDWENWVFRAAAATTVGLGFNATPSSAYYELDRYLRTVEDAYGNQRFPYGLATVATESNRKNEFLKNDPVAAGMMAALRYERATGTAAQRERFAALTEVEQRHAENERQYLAGEITGRMFRHKTNEIKAQYRDKLKELAEGMDLLQTNHDREIVDSWLATYDDPEALDPATGNPDPDRLDRVQARWKEDHPGEYERLIRNLEVTGYTPLHLQLEADRDLIEDSGYFELEDKAWSIVQRAFPSARGYDDFASYIAAIVPRVGEAEERDRLIRQYLINRRDPISTTYVKLLFFERLKLQSKVPELAAALSRWGYNDANPIEILMSEETS